MNLDYSLPARDIYGELSLYGPKRASNGFTGDLSYRTQGASSGLPSQGLAAAAIAEDLVHVVHALHEGHLDLVVQVWLRTLLHEPG